MMDLSLADVVRLLAWGEMHTDGLKKHKSWLKDLSNHTLPGAEIAVAEVEKDTRVNLDLMLKLYERRNELQKASATEARRVETPSGSVHDSAAGNAGTPDPSPLYPHAEGNGHA